MTHEGTIARREARLGWLLAAPAVGVILLVSLVPIGATIWEAMHRHDLRLPWLGRPFVGLDNFAEAAADPRFGAAVLHTVGFALVSVPLELMLGLTLAMIMHRVVRGRGIIRMTALLPWAVPTVVAALIWRFMFDAQAGIVTDVLRTAGVIGPSFDLFVDPVAAWVPIVLADVWKTTPFVALLILAGLQSIPGEVYEAARVDGAGRVRRFVAITLPLLRPAILVALLFRTIDAFRVFDLVYVMTGGRADTSVLQYLGYQRLVNESDYGMGSALAVVVFVLIAIVSVFYVRWVGAALVREDRT